MIQQLLEQINQIVVGKELQVKLALACLLADGHLLIEDIPGVGKTTLSQVLAISCGLNFKRVQFTSDLLPSDILGVSIFNRDTHHFEFKKGAVFTNLLLADEINRASSKTQSALLEVMEEYQVSVDGQSHHLEKPFFVVATQNSHEQLGTHPLPESQMDRFLIRISLGYPSKEKERALWQRKSGRQQLEQIKAVISSEDILCYQEQVRSIHLSEAIYDYLEDIIQYTRESGLFVYGLSPRAGLALIRMTQAWAYLESREYALPDDLQIILPYVANHRLMSADPSMTDEIIAARLMDIAIP